MNIQTVFGGYSFPNVAAYVLDLVFGLHESEIAENSDCCRAAVTSS